MPARWLLASGLLVVGVLGVRTPVNHAASVWQPTVIPPEVQGTDVQFRGVTTVPAAASGPFATKVFAAAGGFQLVTDSDADINEEGYALLFDGFNWKQHTFPSGNGTGCAETSGIFGVSSVAVDAGVIGTVDAADYHLFRGVGTKCNARERSSLRSARLYLDGRIDDWAACRLPNGQDSCAPQPSSNCVNTPTAPGCVNQPYSLNQDTNYQGHVAPYALHDIDYFDQSTWIAVGDECEVVRSTDGGNTWNRVSLPGCTQTESNDALGTRILRGTHHLRAVSFAQDYSVSVDAWGNRPRHNFVWIVGEQKTPQVNDPNSPTDSAALNRVWFSPDGGTSWVQQNAFPTAGAPTRQHWYDVQAVYDNNKYSVVISGSTAGEEAVEGHKTRTARLRLMECDAVAGGLPNCNIPNLDFGTATANTDGTVPFGSSTLQADLRQISLIKDSSSNPTFRAWVTAGTASNYNDGQILFSDTPLAGANATWSAQGVTTNQDLYGVAATSLTRAWAAGDAGTFMQITPSNFSGWGWFGSDGCTNLRSPSDHCDNGFASEPLGWVSLTCANSQTCTAQQAFTYGVSVKPLRQKTTFSCTGDATRSCTTDAECSGAGTCNTAPALCTDANQAVDVGALSGFAWTGALDLAQINPVPGKRCDEAGGESSCIVSGWLSFERVGNCTESEDIICRSDSDCGNSPTDVCRMTPPTAPFQQLPTVTACGKSVQPNSSNSYVVAALDYASDRVEGWAHFLGDGHAPTDSGWVRLRGPYRCGTAYCTLNRTRACTSDAQCAGVGVCDVSLPDANDHRLCTVTLNPAAVGLTEHYDSCTDCTTDDNGTPANSADDRLTCKICTHIQAIDWWNSAYTQRRQITVSPAGVTPLTSSMTATYSVDANTLASQADFDDLRVVYKSPTGFAELDREVVSGPGGIEEVRFRVVKPLTSGQEDDNYFLYFNNATAPAAPGDRERIYEYFEDFSTDVIASGEWTTSSSCGINRFSVSGGRLSYNGSTATDCYAFRQNTHTQSLSGTVNVDGIVRITTSGTAHQAGWAWQNNARYIWLDAIKRPGDDKVFFKSGSAGPLEEDGPSGVEHGTSDHRLRWRQRITSDTSREQTGILDGAAWLRADGTPVTDTHSTVQDGTIGVHAWAATQAQWDDLRVWQDAASVMGGNTVNYDATSPSLVSASGPMERWSCNVCGSPTGETQCGIGRCSANSVPTHQNRVCLNHEQCGGGNGTCEPVGRCSNSGEVCFTSAECGGGGTCTNLGENTCNSCNSCQLYGVSIDAKGGSAQGFAYSADVGYVDFSLAYLYSRSWVQVVKGSIYSRGDVGSSTSRQAPALESTANSPATSCNATYVIRANGSIVNQCAQGQLTAPENDPVQSPVLRPGFSVNQPIELPQQNNNFRTVTDRLDIEGLVTPVNGGKNKYGNLVVEPPSTITSMSELINSGELGPVVGPHCLSNKVVYVHNRDFTIDVDPVFDSCTTGGRGTLLISGGNLTVTTNTSYRANAALTRLTDLPAFGIIVIPDHTAPTPGPVSVSIHPSVTQSIGNYFVNGTIVVESYLSAVQADPQFVHQGVMVASQFRFNRRYSGTLTPEPSEKIINDGRVALNPPPGFESLTAQLPTLRDTRP